jgi:Putative peptidoglycan binding domain
VRDRCNDGRRAAAGAAGALATIGLRIWGKAAHRPVDSLSILGASAASLVIIVNAVFLQTGPHLAPFFAVPTSPPPAAESRSIVVGPATPKPVEAAPARSPAGPRTPQTISARRNNPIADLIGSPSRVIVVQRILSEFGYGQIKVSGILDEPTTAAIEKFEREHKMPVTGRLSDRLFSGLAAATGRPLE